MLCFLGFMWNLKFHPRTGMLVRTVKNAANSFIELCAVFVIVFCLFAVFGWSYFGRRLSQFKDTRETFKTLFLFILGFVPKDMDGTEGEHSVACGVACGLWRISF